jgi:phosphate transport system substrate-binding protein
LMSRNCSPRVGVWFFLSAFALSSLAVRGADPEAVKPTAEWSGSVENEALEKIAPPFLTSAEGLGILWKAWGLKGDSPKVDFDESLVVVSTTRGGRLKVGYAIDEKDDLAAVAVATRDLRPGFRYHLGVVGRGGVASVNGVPVPALPRLAGPTPSVAKPYFPETTLTGTLQLNASNTTSHLVELWSAAFQKFHPRLKVSIKAVGGETVDPAWTDDRTAVTFISRPVGADELGAWEKKLNQRVMAFPIFEDEIALIVHKDNPVKQLTLPQLKTIFAAGKDRPNWGAVGRTDSWAAKPIFVHGRDELSGTRTVVCRVCLGDGKDTVDQVHGSYSSLVKAVAGDPASIGYCRDLFVKEGVRSVPIVTEKGTQPTFRRTCNVVVAMPPGKPIPPSIKEFLVFLYRSEGQTPLFQDGFQTLNKDVINSQLERLGLDEIK